MVALAGLMDDVQAGQRLAQSSERLQYHAIDGAGALAAAKDQKRLRGPASRVVLQEKFFAHRDAGHPRIAKIFFGFLEVDCGSRDQARNHAVGESGDNIRLEGQSRDMPQPGGQHGGARGISADADDHMGTKFAQHTPAGNNGAGQIEERTQTRGEADVLERANLDQAQLKPGGRD